MLGLLRGSGLKAFQKHCKPSERPCTRSRSSAGAAKVASTAAGVVSELAVAQSAAVVGVGGSGIGGGALAATQLQQQRQRLALLCLGELGRRSDLSGLPQVGLFW
jgi:hypothetical protein